jgi:membrane protein DedA with SNARE-associated domain
VSDEPTAGDAPAAAMTAEQQAGPGSAGSASAEEPTSATPGAARSADPWSDPRLPWEGRPRRVDIACWAAITLSGLYYLALLPFRASLIGTFAHSVTLVVLNGSTEAMVAAAAFARTGHGSLYVVLLASVPGLMKFDLIYWWAGRLWGERVIHLFAGQSERRRRRALKFAERVNRWGPRFTWPAIIITPFLPLPNAIVYAVAGWTGMSWVTFLILDAIGSLAWAGLLVGLGYALGQHAVSVAETVSRYGLWVSIGIVVLVVVGQMRGARAQR